MCGIAGFVQGSATRADAWHDTLVTMTDRIVHRGPDAEGHWFDADQGVALGHRRLAIVDLSQAGHQPMASKSGRYVIVYNGEIYNHLDLRTMLAHPTQSWRGHSDTETLLEAIETWGVGPALERLVGMFAFGLWDRQTNSLTLARDRIGEKPLYYGWQSSGRDRAFLFGSELKALKAHPAFAGEIDRDALTLFMRYAYVPAPYSIYRGIQKLEPGTFLTLSASHIEPTIQTYWSIAQAVRNGQENKFTGTADQSVDALETLLSDAVGRQMMADVPLGAFLSGGIDSSVIVALMQAQSSRPVQTFSIGFHEAEYNEADHAKAVAAHLGTDHTELYVTANEAMDVIPDLPQLYDEPFADHSQIPTFLVSRLARQKVTVSLSGDAGDELFAGYGRYAFANRFWGQMSRIPRPIRALGERAITSVPPSVWNRLGNAVPAPRRPRMLGDKLHKGAGVLSSVDAAGLYRNMVSLWRDPEAIVNGGLEPLSGELAPELDCLSDIERMMALDMVTYLPGDILTKVDRAAMGVSLETRVPFLDHRVVEFAWSLPMDYKLRAGQTKWVLRQVLYRHVPQRLVDRPKMGFALPNGAWLRGPLRAWAEDLLNPERLSREGYFDPEIVSAAWRAHLSGHVNIEYRLWPILMFQQWLHRQSVHDGADEQPNTDYRTRLKEASRV